MDCQHRYSNINIHKTPYSHLNTNKYKNDTFRSFQIVFNNSFGATHRKLVIHEFKKIIY